MDVHIARHARMRLRNLIFVALGVSRRITDFSERVAYPRSDVESPFPDQRLATTFTCLECLTVIRNGNDNVESQG
jgi:hypothetical protein